jgi:hypothetical protein
MEASLRKAITVRLRFSHSIVLGYGNALIFRRKFFLLTVKTRPTIRQISLLLISKEKSRGSNLPRLRQLSPTISQFFASSIAVRILREDEKRPSAPYSTILSSPSPLALRGIMFTMHPSVALWNLRA